MLRKHIERWRNRRQLAVAVLTSDFRGSAAATATSGQSNSTWGRIAARTDRLVVLASWFQFAFPCRLISWFLWHTRICAETASRSVQPFLPNTQSDTHTDAHTHTYTHAHTHTTERATYVSIGIVLGSLFRSHLWYFLVDFFVEAQNPKDVSLATPVFSSPGRNFAASQYRVLSLIFFIYLSISGKGQKPLTCR